MSEQDKKHIGDGSDNYADAARKTADAIKHAGQSTVQKSAAAAGEAAAKGAEATANAAAATVKAGVESGKAVAEIASGAAAGGPWGAIIAAAWALRHTLFKILVTACLFLMFIIVMIVSLPTIVFNYVFRTDPATIPPSAPTDIFQIYEEMSATVADSVAGGYDYARAEVERIIAEGGYDHALSSEATIDYGRVSADYDVCYILAAYSASMEQTGATKQDMENKLKAVMPLMFPVTYEVKTTTVTIPAASEGEEPTTETISYVQATIHPFNAPVILTAFGIDPGAQYGQFNTTVGEVIISMATSLRRTLYGVTASGQVPPITDAELQAILNSLDCSPARKEIVRVALSIVGRVPYFWGGYSSPGWNDAWNTPRLVTAAGSSSTGTIRPFGLDCGGYTDWVYRTAVGHSLRSSGSWRQWDNSFEITEAQLLPGDLGFKQRPQDPGVNHVLIYIGTSADGRKLWAHSTSSGGGVVLNSPTYVKYFRRASGIDLETFAVTPTLSAIGG
jgi:cell wall-associated NlpC family hydrolase